MSVSSLIKLKRSSIEGKIPSIQNLQFGEIALNTFDGKLFIKKDNGVESVVSLGEVGFTGSAGDAGPTGFTGSQGVQGDIGFTGSIGAIGFTGSQGAEGIQGIVGFTGSQGIQGFTGSQGFQGNIGFTGSSGSTGFTGSQGVQGDIGFTGSQGIQGIQGFVGSQGIQGIQGFVGSQGIQGIQGFTGSQGIQGDIGFTGSQGIQGFTGSQGIQGLTGFTGSEGLQGFTGSKGPQGTSIVIIGSVEDVNATNDPQAVLNTAFPNAVAGNAVIDVATGELWVYDGNVWDDVGTIVGPQGDQGFTGSQGIQGDIGFTGSQGIQGFTGSQGDQGFTGSQGIQGIQGIVGFTGSQGIQGFTGSQGVQGDIGFTGSQGIQGDVGFTGSQGDIGFTGSNGFTGSKGSFDWSVKTANYTAINLDAIIANTSGGSFTITLPATPSLGDFITVADGADWSLNPLTVARNGSTIEGSESNFLLNVNDIRVEFVYDGSTWQVYTNIGRRGENGFTGSQGGLGPIGFTGSQGVDGIIGFTGSSGPSNVIDAVNDDSAVTHFPVFVAGTGNQTSRLSNTGNILSFVPSTGALSAVDFNSTSDVNLKENIAILENALDKVLQINGVTYNFKLGDTKNRVGVIAQEVEIVLPQVVSENSEGFKTVSYGSMVGLLIEAVKDLNKKINSLEKGLNK